MKTNFSAPYSRRKAGLVLNVVATAIAACALSANALAQQSPRIILQNSENTEIELEAGSDLIVNPISGNVTATPADPAACTGTVGPTCDDVDVDITSLTRSSDAVPQGTNVQLNWASRGAWECTGSGLPGTTWNTGNKLPSGSQSVQTGPLDPDTYTVVLNCENGPVTDQATVSLEILDPNPNVPQFCIDQGRVPPSNLIQDTNVIFTTGSGTGPLTTTWLGTFGNNFPNGAATNIEVDNGKYVSLSFNTGSLSGVGQFAFNAVQFSSFVKDGRKLLTISECPGDFGPQPDPDCQQVVGNSTVRWTASTELGRCDLDPNTTYYLNFVYTDLLTPPTSTPSTINSACTGNNNPDGRCGNRMVF